MARVCEWAIELAGDEPSRAFVRLDTAREDNAPTRQFYDGLGMVAKDVNYRLTGQPLVDLSKNNT
jgi:hypothetical protein